MILRTVSLVLALTASLAFDSRSLADGDARTPDLSGVRFFSQAELLGVQQSVFETLFLQPWDEAHWEYALDAEVRGRGIYVGRNQYGQEFELDIKAFNSVDLNRVALPIDQRAWVEQGKFTLAGTIGELRHRDSRARVHGMVVSNRDVDGNDRWRFWLFNTVSWDNALFRDPPPAPCISDAPASKEAIVEIMIGEGGGCAGACARRRNDAVRSAGRAYDTAVAAALAPRDAQIEAATQIYQTERDDAGVALAAAVGLADLKITACLIGCAFAGPVAPAGVAGCDVVFSGTVAAALAVYESAVTAAANRRDIAISAANTQFSIAVTAAETNYGDALDAAATAYAECLRECGPNVGGGGPGPIRAVED
jgi:hypothetical protein